MRCKTLIILFFALFLVSHKADSQTVSRWLSFPRETRPGIIKDPLAHGNHGKTLLKFQYETEPVTPLMRKLFKTFPEAFPPPPVATQTLNIGRSTMMLKELKDEADEILQHQFLTASDSIKLPSSQIR